MTAIACLKIVVGDLDHPPEAGHLAAMVAKIAGAYLESTWLWPRRSGLVAPFAFLLVDPQATRLDAKELQALARDLHLKLFGVEGQGDVTLLLFEGDQSAVMRFAGTPRDQLRAMLQGAPEVAVEGRLCRVTPNSVESLAPPGGPVAGEIKAGAHDPAAAASAIRLRRQMAQVGWIGVYYLPNETFVGGGAAVSAAWEGGLEHRCARPFGLEHDLLCLSATREVLPHTPTGYLFMPLDFSSVIRPSARAAIKAELETLPADQRGRLAATILNVPREPSHGALAQISSLLRPHVAFLDLKVSDPDFRVDLLPAKAATSVTLTLDSEDPSNRLSSIRRFLAQQQAFKAKRIWQGVTDIASAKELDMCRLQSAPFLSGPAISDLLPTPVCDLVRAPGALPLRIQAPLRDAS